MLIHRNRKHISRWVVERECSEPCRCFDMQQRIAETMRAVLKVKEEPHDASAHEPSCKFA